MPSNCHLYYGGQGLCLVYLVAILVGFLRGSVLKVDLVGVVNKKGDFRFWIESDASGVSLYFRYQYVAAILWNCIQDSLGSLCLALLFIKLDTLQPRV